jgi:hypothetical protein
VDSAEPGDPAAVSASETRSGSGVAAARRLPSPPEDGDGGIMSAIDFTLAVDREARPASDRVRVTMSGTFLPYKKW